MPISAQQWRVSVGLFNCSRMRWLLKGGGAKKKARAPSPSKTNTRVVKSRVPLLLLYLMAVACVTPPLLLLIRSGDVELNPGPVEAAETVLKEYRDRFVAEMDASTVVSDFVYHGIIPDGARESMAKADGPRQRNSILHDYLLKTCTNEALKTACGIITSVQGNPRMSALGKDMQRRLESVEGVGGGGMGGERQVESFFGQLRNFYRNMKVVQDEWLPADQSLQYVNLALAPFKLDHHHAHEMFVDAVKEGVDNVYTERSGKIQCEEIPKLAKEHKTVVVSGAPGVGKSTIARKVCKDICQAPDCHGYILVLLVELRDLLLFKKDFQLVDILQLFQGEMGDATTPMELSKAISSNKGKDVLFILDGFDELPPHLRQSDFLVNLLSHNRNSPLRDCDVVLTSRSIVTSEIYHHMRESRAQVDLTNIEVLGFTQDQIKEYAGHYFKGQGWRDLLESFVSKIDAIPQVRGLCSIPVVLSIICQVFSFKQDLPPTLTEIYNDYMCIKVLKYYKDLTPLDSILDLPRDHDIYKLGKIAFDCIRSQKMIFQSSDLQGLGERFSDCIKGCGVLTARPVQADPKSKKTAIASFYFIHLTVQEFIAAVYVSLLPAEEQREIWAKYLGKPHMAQVWRFYCGLTQLTHYELLQANITGYHKDFQMQCLFESQNASLVQKLMPHIVGEEVRVEPKTAYDSTAYGYCLSKHLTLKELTIETEESAGSVEIHRLLEPVYASGTLQTLDLDLGPEDWRQVEDLFDRIRNCDGDLKGHFGKVHLKYPPFSVAVKLLCLQHVREVECVRIQGCEAMDHEVLKEMEKALGKNKILETLVLIHDVVILPKEFCRHLMIGIGQSISLSEVYLSFFPDNWDCPRDVPADIHGSVQHVTLRHVPLDVLSRLFLWFSQAKHFECHHIHPPHEAMNHEVLKEMEKALEGNKTLQKLTLIDDDGDGDFVTLPKEFCRHLMIGIGLNTSLSEVYLSFFPDNWDCPRDVPVDINGSVQHVTLECVPVDVLSRLFLWFNQVKHFKCHLICPPQEDGVGERDVKFTEVEQTLSGMGRLEKLVLRIGFDWSDSLMVEFGVSVLKGISGNKHTSHFVLYDWNKRDHLLRSIIGRLPTDEQRQFIIDKYTKYRDTFPCISRSASGHPTLTWTPPQHFHPRPAYPHLSAVQYDTHSVRQHQVPPPPRWPPLPTPQPFDPVWMVPSAIALHPHQVPYYTVGPVYPPLGYSSPPPPQGWFPSHQVPPRSFPSPHHFNPSQTAPSPVALLPLQGHQVPPAPAVTHEHQYQTRPHQRGRGHRHGFHNHSSRVPHPSSSIFGHETRPSNSHRHGRRPSSSPRHEPHPSSSPRYEPHPSSSPRYEPHPSSSPRYEPRPFSSPRYEPHPSSSPRYEPRPSSSPRHEPCPANERRPSSSTVRDEPHPSNSTFRQEPHPSNSTFRQEPHPYSTSFRHGPHPPNLSPFPPGNQDVATILIPPELVDQFSAMYSYSQWGNPPVPPHDQD